MITGKTLRDAFISGANNITNHRQEVDALNVFPVPDGDTGTNMSMTISAARREIERMDDEVTVAQVSQTTAAALLRGARGNSGVILSLLFRGFSKGLSGKKSASCADIAAAFAMGVESAYKAVMKPTEGTILTVSRLAVEAARAALPEVGEDIQKLWKIITEAAAETLEKTPDMLPVLKKAGVVDAGGKGFVVILEGMASVINGEGIIETAAKGAQAPAPAGAPSFFRDDDGFEGEITFTYCTEFLVLKNGQGKDALLLRAFLETIGDCVVVVDDDEIIKVHVHTDNPGNAMQEALSYGMLTKVKVDNMREQFAQGVSEAKQPQLETPVSDAAPEQTAYLPVDPAREFGIVAVAAGKGIHQLFLDLGADMVVSGGQTMNPSTDEILAAIHATPAKTVFVLPNNKNIIMSAEQAIRLADRSVHVLHTKTIPQGLSAILALDPSADADNNFIEMTRAAERVVTGHVTFAVRDSDFDGHKIKKGEILALENGKLSFTEKDPVRAAVRLVRTMLRRNSGSSFVTVIHGSDATKEQAWQVADAIRTKYGDDIEVAVVDGGQPVYYFILSVE